MKLWFRNIGAQLNNKDGVCDTSAVAGNRDNFERYHGNKFQIKPRKQTNLGKSTFVKKVNQFSIGFDFQ